MTRPQDKAKELAYAQAMILLPQLGVVDAPIERERPDFGLRLAGSRSAGLEVVRAVDQRIAAGRGVKKKMKERVVADLCAAGVSALIDFSYASASVADSGRNAWI
jgi:hypothetical protein